MSKLGESLIRGAMEALEHANGNQQGKVKNCRLCERSEAIQC